MMQWKNTDPRLDIYKRANIIIVRPALNGWLTDVGYGHVETKNGYSITTSYENHKLIDDGDKWDPIWYWIRAPEIKP